jgi:hypothetical protein
VRADDVQGSIVGGDGQNGGDRAECRRAVAGGDPRRLVPGRRLGERPRQPLERLHAHRGRLGNLSSRLFAGVQRGVRQG